MALTFLLLLLTSGISLANALIPNAILHRKPAGIPYMHNHVLELSVTGPNGTTSIPPSLETVYYFDQLIDHNNPALGTFKQRYWANWEFYHGLFNLSPVEN